MTEVRIAYSTIGDASAARQIARQLVEERLAACVNILPAMRSVFRWQGMVQEEREALMIIKTIAPRYAELETWLLANHPYDVPEILALPVAGGSATYLDWMTEESA